MTQKVLVENAQVEPLVAALASYEAQVVILSISEEISGEIFEATALPGEKTGSAGHSASPPDRLQPFRAMRATPPRRPAPALNRSKRIAM